jgi:N6-adenosine-specific RNA methylase IME4
VTLYQIIYADPPWDYRGQLQHTGSGGETTGGAKEHYPTMAGTDLAVMDVPAISDPQQSLLFMWTSNPHLPEALGLMKAWDFKWATVAFVWDKQRVNPGYYTMSQIELCLVGKRGRIPRPRGARNVRQFLSSPRGIHSAKPEEVRRRIEQMFPTQKKIELFAREKVPGWDCWGNGVNKVDPLVA